MLYITCASVWISKTALLHLKLVLESLNSQPPNCSISRFINISVWFFFSFFLLGSTYREVQGVPDTVPEGGVVPPPLDSAWAESTRKKALLKLEKLDTDLKNYKGNSIKESIRCGCKSITVNLKFKLKTNWTLNTISNPAKKQKERCCLSLFCWNNNNYIQN